MRGRNRRAHLSNPAGRTELKITTGNSDAAGDALYAANPGIAQTLTGNSLSDTFLVYNTSDVVDPRAGSDDVFYTAVSYTLPSGVDTLICGGAEGRQR